MNKYISDTFSDIRKAEKEYRQSVENALLEYRQTMAKVTDEATAFKDEAAYISSKKTAAAQKARTEIQLAENVFTVAAKVAANSLRDDLHQHLTTRPSAAFLDALRLYYDFDLCPTHAEIEALMGLNGGNTLGYRAINRTLKKTGAEYRIDSPDSTAYEADISAIEKLSHGYFMCVPDGYHHEAVEVFGGEKHLAMREDGSTYDNGAKWDSTSILMASTAYKQQAEAMDAMADRWSNTVIPSLKHISAYQDTQDPESGETITAAQQMAEDIKATAHAPEIVKSERPDVEFARQMGTTKAVAYEKAAEAVDHFAI